MSPLSQKLSELQPFSWIKCWQNFKSIKFSNLKISLLFLDLDHFFSHVKSIHISESIHKVSRSNNNLKPLNWIPPPPPPGLLPGSRTPGLIGLRVRTVWIIIRNQSIVSCSYIKSIDTSNNSLVRKIRKGQPWYL